MTEFFIRNILFPIIRSGMGKKTEASIECSVEDVHELQKFGNRQDILPIIIEGLRNEDLLGLCEESVEVDRLRCMRKFVIKDNSVTNIEKVLNNHAIPYILLKGAVLQHLYPKPWMRTSNDIDILVSEKNLQKAIQYIVKGTDFKFDKRNYHDVTMVSSDFCLELHFSIKENLRSLDTVLENVWDYAIKPESGYNYLLTSEFQIFHILAHMSYHMVNGGLGIRPFLDLWLLREKTLYDNKKLHELLEEGGLKKFYNISNQLIDVWMENGRHNEITEKLEYYCLKGGVFGEKNNSINQRTYHGVSYLFHRLIVSQEVLENMYPSLRTKKYLMPIYQAKRWTRLLDERKRRGVTSEIKSIGSIDTNEAKEFDAFLSCIGL